MMVELNDLLDIEDVCELTGLSPYTVRVWPRLSDRPDPIIYFGVTPVWHRPDVEEWMAARPRRQGAPGHPRKINP